jgi:anthranilate/para-aminobenzoate synthase component I
MRSLVVSEHWEAAPGTCRVPELLNAGNSAPSAVLYGDGPGADWVIRGDEPIVVLDRPRPERLHFERTGELPEIRPDLIGFLSYELGYRLDPAHPEPPDLDRFPECYLAVYRRIQAYHRPSGTVYTGTRRLASGDERPPQRAHLGQGPFKATRVSGTETAASYEEKVTRIREEIRLGNVYQVNLTRQEVWRISGNLVELAERLWAANPAPFSALISGPGFAVVSSSPERLVRIAGGQVSSSPIKGTVPRGRTEVADEALRQALRASEKNVAELAMITDLVRNDLTRVATLPSVRVEGFPTLLTTSDVHHLSATVTARLHQGVTFEELLAAVFPGGSVTGCPKIAAMKLIRELEEQPRAVYCGALGWLACDLSALDLALPIRTAWVRDDELRFGVGGGVIWDSSPTDEYHETVHKARSLRECLSR